MIDRCILGPRRGRVQAGVDVGSSLPDHGAVQNVLLVIAVLALGCRPEPPAASPADPPIVRPPETPKGVDPPPRATVPPPPAPATKPATAAAATAAPTVDACGHDAVTAVIRASATDLRACYETQLQVQQVLMSKVIVRWAVGPDGRVTDAEVIAATAGPPDFGRCVLDTVRRMAFAKPAGGRCQVTWPFVFTAG